MRLPIIRPAYMPGRGRESIPLDLPTSDLVDFEKEPTVSEQPCYLGQEVAGRYCLEKKLGSGAFASVYQGFDISTNELVTVKILDPKYLQPQEGVDVSSIDSVALQTNREILLREYQSLQALEEHNIPSVPRAIMLFGNMLVMNYAEGISLHEDYGFGAHSHEELVRRLQPLREVAQILSEAHAHDIAHKDVKPANILHGDVTWLIDWGCSSDVYHDGWVGTPEYMAPEVLNNEGPQLRSDIFSLGSTIYKRVTGEPAFYRRKNPDENMFMAVSRWVNSQRIKPMIERSPVVPLELSALVAAMLDKNPENRPTAQETVFELDNILA